MRDLPKNVCKHPDGYLVRIVRGDLKWSAFVPHSRPDALAHATTLRDKFYAVCPAAARRKHSKHARSNTDVVGISETVCWHRGLPHNNFIVHASGKNRRFYYGRQRNRAAAFKLALAHRAKATGQKPATLLPEYF